MFLGHLVDLPSLLEPPRDVMRRLRAIRPNVEVLYTGHGVWMLGEVRPNEQRRESAAKTIRQFFARRSLAESTELWQSWENQVYLRDARLLMQGFAWIGDYPDPLDDWIVREYQRKVWKEDLGLLDYEWRRKMAESDSSNSLLRKVSLMRDKLQTDGRADFRRAALKRRSQRPMIRPVQRPLIVPDHRIVTP